MDFRGPQPWKTNRARALRSSAERAEDMMWTALRNRRLGGYKFSRQVPIGRYFADFACRSEKVVVEVDGATHGSVQELAQDEIRSVHIMSAGYRIVRVHNDDVFLNLENVLDAILAVLRRENDTVELSGGYPSSGLRPPSPR